MNRRQFLLNSGLALAALAVPKSVVVDGRVLESTREAEEHVGDDGRLTFENDIEDAVFSSTNVEMTPLTFAEIDYALRDLEVRLGLVSTQTRLYRNGIWLRQQ